MILNNTAKRVINIADDHRLVRVLPGANTISDEVWNRVRSSVVPHLNEGLLVEIGAEKKGDKVVYKSLKDLPPKEAEEVVRGTYDLKTLEEFRNTETRDSVRALILSQVENLKARPQEKK